MICQRCKNNASVHLTQRVGESRQELHLCLACAQKAGLAVPENPPDLALDAVVQSLIVAHVGELVGELADLSCPDCGIKYMEFRAEGRLGCPHDYTTFRGALETLVQRIHRGVRHVGKVPLHFQANRAWQEEVVRLRRQLRTAVETEAYEEAARLRDLLRQKEARHESG